MTKVKYNCAKCPGYCCSYPLIEVRTRDVTRLAKYFKIPVKRALQRFTKKGEKKGERVMRHKRDENFASICMFFDQENWRCSIYEARPQACRNFPGQNTCGYYEFLKFERSTQGDPELISRTDETWP